jgi:putative acetyltransferase
MSEQAVVRLARPDDGRAIGAVLRAAFPSALEAELVEALVAAGDATLSLVAERDGRIVGHILCSRMEVEAEGDQIQSVGLAPLAVQPEFQREGIGAALIREALARSQAEGEEMMFVLGEPAYYGRFGFSAETARPFASPYAGEYFMALRFSGARSPNMGWAEYAPAFASFEQAGQE